MRRFAMMLFLVSLCLEMSAEREPTFEQNGTKYFYIDKGSCSVCGYDAAHYHVGSGLYKDAISIWGKSVSGVVTIPSHIDGIPVTAISNYAFYNCKRITGVVVPSTVKSVGDWAFYRCTGMNKITFPEEMQQMGAVV